MPATAEQQQQQREKSRAETAQQQREQRREVGGREQTKAKKCNRCFFFLHHPMMHAHGGGLHQEFILHQSVSISYKSVLIYIKPIVTQQTEAIQPID